MKRRTVQVADEAGYCFGVRRALDLALENLSGKTEGVYSLGPIIHNPQVVEEFRQKGMIPVDSIDEVEDVDHDEQHERVAGVRGGELGLLG